MDDMFVKSKKKAHVLIGRTDSVAKPINDKVPEPVFTPPEVIAAKEEKEEEFISKKAPNIPIKPPKKAFWWKRLNKKKKLLIIVLLAIVLLVGAGIGVYFLTKKDPVVIKPNPEPVTEKIVEPPKPTTEASKLTGVQVEFALNARGVTAIMIENSVDARPQSGLLSAGIVYEAIAEGGITRFLALYQEAQPDYIGPVRSARPYYIDWLLPYSPSFAHAGGSPEAISMISNLGIKDMEHGVNGSSYQRVSNRYAPHNLYTSMASLDAIRAKKGWAADNFTGFTRKADAPSKVPTAIAVNLKISSVLFDVHYDYDAATNSYKRSEGGKPHIDERSGTQLNPKVVIALVVPYSIHPDGVHSKYQTIGSGQAYIFQDGIMQEATWTKASQAAQIEFRDAGGRVLTLNAGQTWITAVGLANMVTFSGPPIVTPVGT